MMCVTGYANEVGEAFRALVPVSVVWASYAVATAYVSADALDKGKKAAVVREYSSYFLLMFYQTFLGFENLSNSKTHVTRHLFFL